MPVTRGIPGLLGALVTTITLGLLTEIDKNIRKKYKQNLQLGNSANQVIL